ncbi:MAG TPA: cystathionine beta-lyase [Hyphomicrobiales bacterium]|nr:cystathionine beta-lyase [Hyphomicrobiales bacterium]
MAHSPEESARRGANTRLVSAGRDPADYHGFVNPPVYHASTVVYPTADDFFAHRGRYQYGRRGTPTSEGLTDAVAEIEGGAGAVLAPSGLAAITTALLSVVGAGDHLLVADSVYGPTRAFCSGVLKRLGVETTYYDPTIGDGIAALMRDNTRAVFTESPGSLTFEVQDIPAIAAVAHARGACVLMDNTWATPLYFRAHDHGVDLSIQAGTKFLSGHSDVMIGTISANAEWWPRLIETHGLIGQHVGPDDVYLALRGFRTLGVRLERHQESGLRVARFLSEHPDVARVLHPALPGAPGHDLWRRDFTGACGLFAVELKPRSDAAIRAFLDALRLFAMGYSWGGFESLCIATDPRPIRTATTWQADGPMLRLHIGLEDVDDLIADLAGALGAYAAA